MKYICKNETNRVCLVTKGEANQNKSDSDECLNPSVLGRRFKSPLNLSLSVCCRFFYPYGGQRRRLSYSFPQFSFSPTANDGEGRRLLDFSSDFSFCQFIINKRSKKTLVIADLHLVLDRRKEVWIMTVLLLKGERY